VTSVVLVVVALITYASRLATLVFLPRPSGRFEAALGRMPAPIFASLAMLTLVNEDRSVAGSPIVYDALGGDHEPEGVTSSLPDRRRCRLHAPGAALLTRRLRASFPSSPRRARRPI
jgi:hypothetical protein